MTRSRHGAPPPARPQAPRPGRARWITVALVGLLAVAAVFAIRRFAGPERGGVAIPTDSERVMLDSLRAADARHDWPSALLWSERLGVTRPLDHGVLLARGKAWGNYAIEPRAGRLLARPALRLSLERAASLQRAIGLVDSSSRAAGSGERWLDSGKSLAEYYLQIGLPGEALLAYETVKDRMPNEMWPMMRAYWIRALLYDPVHPDTSEYHARMEQLRSR